MTSVGRGNVDPEPGTELYEHLRDGNAQQVAAGKRLCSKLLVRDDAGRVLIVDPSYKPYWDLPGGMAGKNESPSATATREFQEELGVAVSVTRPLLIDWEPAHGPWDDQLVVVFDVGVLDAEVRARLHIADAELRAFAFLAPEEATSRLRPDTAQRLRRAFAALTDAPGVTYSELS